MYSDKIFKHYLCTAKHVQVGVCHGVNIYTDKTKRKQRSGY